MILINGEKQSQITVSDRGLQYGDGLFETIEVLNQQLVFFEEHYQRLSLGCERLLLPCPNKQTLTSEAERLIKNCQQGVLKIILTRGTGGRGYKQPDKIQPTRVISLHPYPHYPKKLQTKGINARFCNQRLGINPSLAGIKHLNRLEQVLARSEWETSDIQEGIMLDINDFVVEGTMSNLFFVKQHKLYTPELNQTGIKGIMREFIIKTARKNNIPIEQGNYSKAQLLNADEVFVTNSVIGIWSIKQLDITQFTTKTLTQCFQSALIEYKQQFL